MGTIDDAEGRIRAHERAFRRAGLPNLIEGYSATEDIFTRAIPVLTLVFAFELLGAINLEWDSALANVFAFLGGVAILLGAFGLLNLLRGRPFASIPTKVGVPELVAFVVLPALLPLIFGGQWRSALATIAGQLVLLAAIYVFAKYGIISILRWTGGRFVEQLAASGTLLVRALPLLLFFSLVTFFTNEYWQMFGRGPEERFWAAIVLFAGLAAVFLLVQLSRSVLELERGSDLAGEPLRRAQRVNVGLVIFLSQALQVAFVTLAVWTFFVVFGALLVRAPVRMDWLGTFGTEVLTIPFFGGTRIVITRELLRTAGGVAAFSALYYTVAMALDSSYRDELVTRITEEMRETFARRAEYLRLFRGRGARPAGGAPSPSRSAAGG